MGDITEFYLDARDLVLKSGYTDEYDASFHVTRSVEHQDRVLSEASWVILASGMRDSVVSDVHPKIEEAFGHWEDVGRIRRHAKSIRARALNLFRHAGKIDAIMYFVHWLDEHRLESFTQGLKESGPEFLLAFPFMGPATSVHLAKNLGFDVVKPDRHLLRLAELWGYCTPLAMCTDIRSFVGDPLRAIDTILWRYSVISGSLQHSQRNSSA